MTATADTQTIVTVEDKAGLEALPVGAWISDSVGDHFVRQPHGFVLRNGVSPWLEEELEQWLPAEVINPEILGEFYSPAFEAGDYVRIKGGTALQSYAGIRCRVLEDSAKPWRSPRPYLQPLDSRPENYMRDPFHPFFWDADKLEKIEDIHATIKVGDRVRFLADYGHSVGAGDLAAVVEAGAPFFDDLDRLITVKMDRPNDVQEFFDAFAWRFELANDTTAPEPTPETFEFEDNTLAVVMDAAGLKALPNHTVIVDAASDYVWVKVLGKWAGINRIDGSLRDYDLDESKTFLVKHYPS